MSNNYSWYEHSGIIECMSFKAAYQLCRQMYRHHFHCESDFVKGNTRIMLLHKCKTDIIIYVYNQLREPITNTTITYNDYIRKVVKRYENEKIG